MTCRPVHLDDGAVLGPLVLDRRQRHDRLVLRGGGLVHQPLQRPQHIAPLVL
ncbi:hypothetical protein [Phycicoccus avicenniae]|uniref:hypothetical protein n=1 Tax=Phycicoccus avicenniae TaxID=2828860 RepID=UPI003D277B4F